MSHQVETLMRLDTKYRNSDKELILKIWSYYGFRLTREQKRMFMDLPSVEAITRRRREFSGKYPASAITTERRFKNFKKMRDEFSTGSFFRRFKRT